MQSPDITALIPIHRDNGSREWLQQAVNSLGKDVRVLVLENDGEVAEAFNAGLEAADTEYVLFMGADDVADAEMVNELRAAIWDVDVTYPEMRLVSEDLSTYIGTHNAVTFCPWRLQQLNYVSGCALVRREKALAVGGFRDLTLEDWDLWVRMARDGARFKPVPAAILNYRQVENSRRVMAVESEEANEMRRTILGADDPTADLKATFYFTHTPAVAYLRCQLPARHLPAIASDALEISLHEKGYSYPWHRGTAVFQLAADRSRAIMSRQLQQDGFRVLVETDDNYFAPGSQWFRARANWGKKIGDGPHTVEGHAKIVRDADGVIVTTRYLADQYRKHNPNVYVCGNQVDPDDWQPLQKPEDDVFRIGWFASRSHADDAGLVRRALEWASRQNGVEVVLMGFNPGWRFDYQVLPWANDLSVYRQMLQLLDVGVAPVIGSPFARGRSDVKWLEYSMAGVAGVVSDIDCYETVPDDLTVKATDAKGFLTAVQHLVRNRDEARQMAQEAREHVLAKRTIRANIGLWEAAING